MERRKRPWEREWIIFTPWRRLELFGTIPWEQRMAIISPDLLIGPDAASKVQQSLLMIELFIDTDDF